MVNRKIGKTKLGNHCFHGMQCYSEKKYCKTLTFHVRAISFSTTVILLIIKIILGNNPHKVLS